MKVTKKADIIRGLEKLGLQVEVGKTKVPEWERLHVHRVILSRTKDNMPLMEYVCKISLHHGMLYSFTYKGLPEYYAYAIKLMLNSAIILNHINYLALCVKASNACYHLLERAEKESDKKLKMKAMTQYHWERRKLITKLFNDHYYNGDQTKGGNYAF